MIVFAHVTGSTGLTTRNIVFKIAIKCLVFAILNFQICEVATAVLSC